MELHTLYGNWIHAKSEVVHAAENLMRDRYNASAVAELEAMLLAEKHARSAFESAFTLQQEQQ